MPRITIERQLELLYEELVKANQSQTARYEELHHAANHLKLQRQEKISGERFIALTQQFHDATDGEAQGRLRNTGKLIVSAVCDQAAGISEAVYSLQTWLTDPIRFDSQWISAVNRTIEQATCELR